MAWVETLGAGQPRPLPTRVGQPRERDVLSVGNRARARRAQCRQPRASETPRVPPHPTLSSPPTPDLPAPPAPSSTSPPHHRPARRLHHRTQAHPPLRRHPGPEARRRRRPRGGLRRRAAAPHQLVDGPRAGRLQLLLLRRRRSAPRPVRSRLRHSCAQRRCRTRPKRAKHSHRRRFRERGPRHRRSYHARQSCRQCQELSAHKMRRPCCCTDSSMRGRSGPSVPGRRWSAVRSSI